MTKNNKFLKNLAIADKLSLCSIIAISSLSFIEGTRLKRLTLSSVVCTQIQELDTEYEASLKTTQAARIYEINLKNASNGEKIDFKSNISLTEDDIERLRGKLVEQHSDWRKGIHHKLALKIPLRYDYRVRYFFNTSDDDPIYSNPIELTAVDDKPTITIKVRELRKLPISNVAKRVLNSLNEDQFRVDTETKLQPINRLDEIQRISLCLKEANLALDKIRLSINKAKEELKKAKSQLETARDHFIDIVNRRIDKNGSENELEYEVARNEWYLEESKVKEKENDLDDLKKSLSEDEIKVKELESQLKNAHRIPDKTENVSSADWTKGVVNQMTEEIISLSKKNPGINALPCTSPYEQTVKSLERLSERDDLYGFHMHVYPESETNSKCTIGFVREKIEDEIRIIASMNSKKLKAKQKKYVPYYEQKNKLSEWSYYLRSIDQLSNQLPELDVPTDFEVWLNPEKPVLTLSITNYKEIEKLPKIISSIRSLQDEIGLKLDDTCILLNGLYGCLSDIYLQGLRIGLNQLDKNKYSIDISHSDHPVRIIQFCLTVNEKGSHTKGYGQWYRKKMGTYITKRFSDLDELMEGCPFSRTALTCCTIGKKSFKVDSNIPADCNNIQSIIKAIQSDLLDRKSKFLLGQSGIEWLIESYTGLDPQSILDANI